MLIKKHKFGEYNGQDVFAYSLENESGLAAEILSYGGIIRKLVYKNTDVVLGRDSMDEYINNSGYFGAIIGRNSNRIENAEFELCGRTHKLAANNGRNNLHGGKAGFDKKVWSVEAIDGDEPSLVLSLVSPDGEEGFPGEARVKVTYTLTNDNSLKIHYFGECDEDTILNMTNHSYFNLNGHSSGDVSGHSLWLDSDFYTPNNDECVPTGEILSVKNTPFDFSLDALMGERLNADHCQIRKFEGFDHNFVLKGKGYRKVGKFIGDKTGIAMEIYTDQIGMQIYSGNVIEKGRICKDGAVYAPHHAVCFETQAFPNSINVTHFPSPILKKGAQYDTVTSYKFI